MRGPYDRYNAMATSPDVDCRPSSWRYTDTQTLFLWESIKSSQLELEAFRKELLRQYIFVKKIKLFIDAAFHLFQETEIMNQVIVVRSGPVSSYQCTLLAKLEIEANLFLEYIY